MAFLRRTSSCLVEVCPSTLTALSVKSANAGHVIEGVTSVTSIGVASQVVFGYATKEVRGKFERTIWKLEIRYSLFPIDIPMAEDVVKNPHACSASLDLGLYGASYREIGVCKPALVSA